MGFQQSILDQIIIAFISAIGSIMLAIIAFFLSYENLLAGLSVNFIGLFILFFALYRYYYKNKFGELSTADQLTWWIILSVSFGYALCMPILLREKILSDSVEWTSLVLPLIAFVLFEIQTFKVHFKKYIFKDLS